ncbi:flavodoxin [Mycobacterium sp. MS1601]|uniref:flavodoxin family protein n=1 Tax=Mycobacterium sp. MS1601 TaxID=1936029 RepID=UPI0009797C75|nr:NAD(P)H-dependent oxidoreductase [Mycobacterium sp. MS1601]AQA05720.1 flavodoxin [Mycobacterium sp. MS1601]
MSEPPLHALALVCTLKPSPSPSSSELIAEHVFATLADHGVTTDIERPVDFDIKPGVEAYMGDGDQWPQIREKILSADILLISTPTWLGHPSSVTQRVLERLDAELSNTDDANRPVAAGKVALVSVVGNEDGAHKIVADLFQALNDIGYTIPSQGCTYWNDEAMGSRDYSDLDEIPQPVAITTATAARNAVHVARLLKTAQYPGV